MGWVAAEFDTIALGDKRLDKRAVLLAEQLASKQPAVSAVWDTHLLSGAIVHTLPEDEARTLLSGPLLLADAPEWSSDRTRPWETSIECGLLDPDGNNVRLIVRL